MRFPNHLSIMFFVCFRLVLLFLPQEPVSAIKKPYIVYLGSHGHGPQVSKADLDEVAKSHHDFLGSYLGSTEKGRDAIIYSYDRHINGFAAMLEEEEADEIARHPKVVSVFLNRGKKLHTTHSWEFMLLEKDGVVHPTSLWKKARFGEDSIIANLDTGVWPESESFSEEGIGPIPSKWRGTCQNNTAAGVPCNRKLIGARFFNKGYTAAGGVLNSSDNSARDKVGHGTHTLSTAGGNFVPGANVCDLANGTAKGGSPKARVVSYKVCWPPANGDECFDADIMKALDMAIHDGVDVISVSLGGNQPNDYFSDSLAIGSFHAVKNGISVVCSAGNGGPMNGTVDNTAPWIITVGASTLDREFEAFVVLRNGKRLKGKSFSRSLLEDKFYHLITGEQAKVANASIKEAKLCKPGSLDHRKAKGKIMVCLTDWETSRLDQGYQASLAGAEGMILCNDKVRGNDSEAEPYTLPASEITYADGLVVFDYINCTDDPQGYITSAKANLGARPAPIMADFSSRGPNMVTPELLKPDITAPGVNIIAAFSQATSALDFDLDKQKAPFVIASGTSMSCPHVAGVVALLRAIHPDWSPAAIRSAIMTTARTRANTMQPILDKAYNVEATPFSYGAGHIRPNVAQDPGLVYDLSINDYLDFFCAKGYNSSMIQLFADGPYRCRESVSIFDFNNPSITVTQLQDSMTVTRKLKNVGSPGKYVVRIREPYGVSVCVEPDILTFKNAGDEKSFKITFKAKQVDATKVYEFGLLTWSDGRHYVRSPMVVSFGDDN